MNISVKDLLDAGVHFGHQTRRWNPRSKPYIFDHRQGVSIIDLAKTHTALQQTCDFVENLVGDGGTVLLVGTKRQAQEIVREAATGTGMPYCVNRWLGGTLTNYTTIKRSIAKFKHYQQMETSGELAKLPKKEESAIKREMARMQRNFDGILDLDHLPGALFVVDVNHEDIAVAEAARCGIPCIALVDTNSDPTIVTHPIPGNDDAVKSIRIIVDVLVEAIQKGLGLRDTRRSARGAADIRAASAAMAAAAPVATVAPAESDVLGKVELPAGVKDIEELVEKVVPVDESGAGKLAAKKKPVRAKED
ncbi:MAG: 30S ribosomal protein S2 [Verrucomicrobia bacterium RIFCSPLOWO2_12_FULL_64_8]|nr:MAG: 30S ribosomal protein S2 [Verrucomicrobia bacterium RIFCSPLOWO2_12_FULL_64_8]